MWKHEMLEDCISVLRACWALADVFLKPKTAMLPFLSALTKA